MRLRFVASVLLIGANVVAMAQSVAPGSKVPVAQVRTDWTIDEFVKSETHDAAATNAQLGVVKIALGEPQDAILAKVALKYNITEVPDSGGTVLVMTKIPPVKQVGSLYFVEGKLVRVQQMLAGSDASGGQVVQALISALDDLAPASGMGVCMFQKPKESTTVSFKIATLYCNGKTINISAIGQLDSIVPNVQLETNLEK